MGVPQRAVRPALRFGEGALTPAQPAVKRESIKIQMWTPDIILEQSAPILGQVPARDKEELVFLGLFLNVVGSFLSAGAFIIQKLTHNDESEVHMCCRWRWWLGFLMLLTSGILEGISLSYAPLSIVA